MFMFVYLHAYMHVMIYNSARFQLNKQIVKFGGLILSLVWVLLLTYGSHK